MKLAISNLAWTKENDEKIYSYLAEKEYEGLEIAPTRIFPESPYEHLKQAEEFAKSIKYHYGLEIPSMQSIWYGKKENIFQSKEERDVLLHYTKKAIDFAGHIECRNLVFGCPKNRHFNCELSKEENNKIAWDFFCELGDYAKQYHAVIAIEANHASYGTDFINTAEDSVAFVKELSNMGVLVNLDTGNLIQNENDADVISDGDVYIHHVHFSEPGLELLKERTLHSDIMNILKKKDYTNYISIEMKRQEHLKDVFKTIDYLKQLKEEL